MGKLKLKKNELAEVEAHLRTFMKETPGVAYDLQTGIKVVAP